jgi:hypothetical protein
MAMLIHSCLKNKRHIGEWFELGNKDFIKIFEVCKQQTEKPQIAIYNEKLSSSLDLKELMQLVGYC